MKSVFGAVAVVIGSMIGVGFASGREIASFFAVFGLWGILFCFVAGIVFAFAVYLILSTDNKNSKAGFLFEKFFVVCSFIVMSTMMAGIFELDTSFGGGKFGLAVGIIFCSFVLVVVGLHSLEKLNGFFVPIILLSIIGLFCTTLFSGKSVGGIWAANSNSGGGFQCVFTYAQLCWNECAYNYSCVDCCKRKDFVKETSGRVQCFVWCYYFNFACV